MSITDPFFGEPYVNVDEWRDVPTRHRHVHGGFEGTDTRFSLWFPPPERYDGRLLQFLESRYGGSEYGAFEPSSGWSMDDLFAHGGFVAESNQGHIGLDLSGAGGDPSIIAWRASAETGRYAKQVAADMYGEPPHHSYVFGGSGGGFRAINCLENVDDVWDAGLVWIMGLPSVHRCLALYLNAVRLLGDKLAQVDDALDAGGGNPFDGLNTEQRRALADLFRGGYPRTTLGVGYQSEAALGWAFFSSDPEYVEDFWTVPGYLGADHPEYLEKDLVSFTARVGRVLDTQAVVNYIPTRDVWDRFGMGAAALVAVDWGNDVDGISPGLVLEGDHDLTKLGCASITILSGAGVGRELRVLGVVGELLVLGAMGGDARLMLNGVKPGDEVRVNNRGYLAFCHYDRYRNDDPATRSYADALVDGWSIYPQRPNPEENWFAVPYTYDVGSKKLIIINNLGDRSVWPFGAVTYREQLASRIEGTLDDQLRLWFLEHAMHTPVSMTARSTASPMHTSLIDYEGHVQRSLRDLVEWVEFEKEPPPSTNYTYTTGGVHLPETVHDRKGIQPVVKASANGGIRAEVAVGEEVHFEVIAEAPSATGRIISVEWDFDGTGQFRQHDTTVDGTSERVQLCTTHTFETPGTHFAVVRVTSHRDGDLGAVFGRMINLGRTRVVVHA